MLRRAFLKAFSALAAIPLLPWFMRREVKRVTLTYESRTISLAERNQQIQTFNDRQLADTKAGELFCAHSEYEIRHRGLQPYCRATVIYERRPEAIAYLNSAGEVIGEFRVFKRSDPILRSMQLIKQDIEYA